MKVVDPQLKAEVVEYVRNFPETSFAQIAKIFGVDRHSVSYWAGASERKVDVRKEWQKNRSDRAKSILIEFLGGGCYQCGYRGCPDALDFHHRNPEEKENMVSNLLHGSFDRIVEEARKCELLCCRCHRENHSEESTLGPNKFSQPSPRSGMGVG